MKVHAYAANRPGLHVEPYEYELSELASHDVRIKVTHCSVGRGDTYFLENKYQIPTLQYPLVAGHELVGVIEQCGNQVNRLQIGDRAGVGYEVWSCGICEYCFDGKENLCESQKCLVLSGPGGFADYVVADERFVCKVPSDIKSDAAAPLFCSGLTVYSAIKKARIKEGMCSAVVGIGGLGHFGVQLLKLKGSKIVAFSGKSGQAAEVIKKMGASLVLPYKSDEVKPHSFDRIFMTTHASVDYDYYLKLLKPTGELWVVGSDINKTTFSSWLLNDFASRSIHGSYIGSPAEMRELLELASAHGIIGRVKTMPMRELNQALQLVASGNDYFRVVVTNE
jgi:uncharacterized zinc-type alcohol dehydrogenase-like protein